MRSALLPLLSCVLLQTARANPHCPHECPAIARVKGSMFDCQSEINKSCKECLACISGKDEEEYWEKEKEKEAALLDANGEISIDAEDVVKEVLKEAQGRIHSDSLMEASALAARPVATATTPSCDREACPPPPPAPIMIVNPAQGSTAFYADQPAISRFAFSRNEALRQGDVIRWVPYYQLSCLGAGTLSAAVYGGELDAQLGTPVHLPAAKIKYGLCVAERPDEVPLSSPWSPTDELFSWRAHVTAQVEQAPPSPPSPPLPPPPPPPTPYPPPPSPCPVTPPPHSSPPPPSASPMPSPPFPAPAPPEHTSETSSISHTAEAFDWALVANSGVASSAYPPPPQAMPTPLSSMAAHVTHMYGSSAHGLSSKIRTALVVILGVAFAACTIVLFLAFTWFGGVAPSRVGKVLSGRRERARRRKGAVRVASNDPDEIEEDGGLDGAEHEDDDWDEVEDKAPRSQHKPQWQDNAWDGGRSGQSRKQRSSGREHGHRYSDDTDGVRPWARV